MRTKSLFYGYAFTIIELMVVLVIMGILATLSIAYLSGAQENSLDKEATSNLKLIAAAEKIYRMEAGGYVAAANEVTINSLLRLMLPTNAATKNWAYYVTLPSGNATFLANATRARGSRIRSYIMNETDEEPRSP